MKIKLSIMDMCVGASVQAIRGSWLVFYSPQSHPGPSLVGCVGLLVEILFFEVLLFFLPLTLLHKALCAPPSVWL